MDTQFSDWSAMDAPSRDAVDDPQWETIVLLARALGLSPIEHAQALSDLLKRCSGCLRTGVAAVVAGTEAVSGVGPSARLRLQSALALGTRLAWDELVALPELTNPAQCADFLNRRCAGLRRELFLCLHLDSRNRLLGCRTLFAGTVDGAAVYPREVVMDALRIGAGSVILAHNHPSGSLIPSESDRHITQRLRAALQLIDVRLLDHLIVGRGATFSMAAHGEAGFA